MFFCLSLLMFHKLSIFPVPPNFPGNPSMPRPEDVHKHFALGNLSLFFPIILLSGKGSVCPSGLPEPVSIVLLLCLASPACFTTVVLFPDLMSLFCVRTHSPSGCHRWICRSWHNSRSLPQEEPRRAGHSVVWLHWPSDFLGDPKLQEWIGTQWSAVSHTQPPQLCFLAQFTGIQPYNTELQPKAHPHP